MSRILLKSFLTKCSKTLTNERIHQQRAAITIVSRYLSSKDRNSWVVLTKNGQTICCWHPEESHPYEHTKPLPVMDPEFHEGDSALKVQYRREAKYRFKPDGPTNEELAKLTYTTKHRWFPNREKRYLDPNPPKDRDGV